MEKVLRLKVEQNPIVKDVLLNTKNYITLMPGESRTLDFEFDADLLPDGKYLFKAEAYNR